MSDRKTVALIAAAEIHDKTMTEETINLYLKACEGLSDEQFEHSIAKLLVSSKWMPKPSEVYEAAGVDPRPPSLESQAITAYNNLEDALSQNKPSVAWPVTRHIADTLGGHQYLWGMTLREFEFKKSQFIKAYIALAECEPEKLKQLEALPHVPYARLPSPEPYQPLIGNITKGRLT